MDRAELEFHLASLQRDLKVLETVRGVPAEAWLHLVQPVAARASVICDLIRAELDVHVARVAAEELAAALRAVMIPPDVEYDGGESAWSQVNDAYKQLCAALVGQVPHWVIGIAD